MEDLIGLDFETYGSVDLPKHGLDRYVKDPHFRPLIACVYTFDEVGNRTFGEVIDFVKDGGRAIRQLQKILTEVQYIAAHNAQFEIEVLNSIGIHLPYEKFIDSAVVSRAAGAGSRLEAAAPQLLGVDKMAEGWDLIKLFSLPGKYQEENGDMAFDPRVVKDNPDKWATFIDYCMLDARLSHQIVQKHGDCLTTAEMLYMQMTWAQNAIGWPVDVKAVEEMQRRYLENQDFALAHFRQTCGATDLNLNSTAQLVAWCKERGVRTRSWDEAHVTALRPKLEAKLENMKDDDPKLDGYTQVLELVKTKQILGGASLKKLQTILDMVSDDGRLRHQYLHAGAGQTMRTTGRGVQMQNLKRLAAEPKDMATLFDDDEVWTNEELAQNLRQVFRSSDEQGAVIVGDFSSVESRGLAYQAFAVWKMDLFRKGKDLYKVLAAKIYSIAEELISKLQRQTGKVAELSCGYGASGPVVKEFAEGLGVHLTDGEASQLVYDWREANPEVVDYWGALDALLAQAMMMPLDGSVYPPQLDLPDGFTLRVFGRKTFDSLIKQVPGAELRDIVIEVRTQNQTTIMRRVFVGAHFRGRDISYYKPSDRKTGDLWKCTYVNPKTKQLEHYKLYGGKLAGICTQSLCREMFFRCMAAVYTWSLQYDNLQLIGQFHDELVLDWQPPFHMIAPTAGRWIGLAEARDALVQLMSNPDIFRSFPMAAEVNSSYRYIK